MAVIGTPQVLKNINTIYDRKKVATYALCLEYAALALNYFRQAQSVNKFWINRTGQAKDLMFTDAKMTTTYISWLMAHGIKYGVYLELANDGQNEAIRPVIMHFLPQFKKDLSKLWEKDL